MVYQDPYTRGERPEDIPVETAGSSPRASEIPVEPSGKQSPSRPTSRTPDITDKAQQQTSQLADKAQQQVQSKLATQKKQATHGMQNLASALDQTSQQLRKQGQESLAEYTTKAAAQVQQLAHYLNQHDMDQLIDETQGYARQHPLPFLAGAFALGFAASRFLKSSAPSSTSSIQ
jgi:glucan phosphorylase